MEFLDKEQTLAYLNDYLISPNKESRVLLPEIKDVSENKKIIFDKNESSGSRNQVWSYEPDGKKSSLLRIGSVLTDNKVLQTDYGYPNLFTNDFGGKRVLKDLFNADKRETFHTETLIAPWSHYFRKEYFLYTIFIAAKLCRIKDALPQEVFAGSVVSYPLYNTGFEHDFLELLGLRGTQIVDSQVKKITFDRCILGNNDNWSYPNVADVLSLRRHVETKISLADYKGGSRVYIYRSGRRRVLNEKALIQVLEKFHFEIIEDEPRSVSEQFSIYNNASFIMGPHGASFTNIVWSRPDTHLFELFAPTYVYNFFLYLAQIMGVQYSAYCYGNIIHNTSYKTVNDDIYVSIPEIEKYLNEVFG